MEYVILADFLKSLVCPAYSERSQLRLWLGSYCTLASFRQVFFLLSMCMVALSIYHIAVFSITYNIGKCL